MIKKKRSNLFQRGVTLVELMVMSVIASLVALTVIQGFSGISRGVIASRFRTLATQLANQKMQSLKSTPYYRLRVSSQCVVPSALSGFSPSVRSDDSNYAPTDAVINGIRFTNYAVVERVEKDDATDALTTKSWNSPDTGLKQITVNIVWQERGAWKRLQLANLLENPNRLAPICDFVGIVKNANTLATLSDASVTIVENSAINTLTDAGGAYRLGAPSGTYSLRVSKRGYFDSTSAPQIITSATPQVTLNFFATPMSSGTITGSVWQNDHLVISRVCGLKKNGAAPQEYAEIFNPTTWTWIVDGQVGLTFQGRLPPAIAVAMNYAVGGSSIVPGGFYLFASTPTLNINGTLVDADAVWNSSNIIPVNGDGAGEGVGVLTLTGPTFDRVGWVGGGGFDPAAYETAPVPDGTGLGMKENEIYYRKSDIGGTFSSIAGPAYDNNNNALDWDVDKTGGNTPPRNTVSPRLPVKSGTPSAGAMIFANDGLSQMVRAGLVGSPPEARFTLPSIATGTWTVSASSGNFFLSYSTTIFSAVNYSTSIVMNTSTIYGFVSGRVADAVTTAGIPWISLSPGAGVTDAAGNFNVALTPGAQSLTANEGGANPAYMDVSQNVTVTLGQVLSNTVFYLNGAGKIRGTVTIDGVTPLPGVNVSATNNGSGYTADNAITASDGSFLVSVPIGVYTVLPATSFGETISPITTNVSVAAGTTVFAATYTVTSAYGTLTGRVSAQGTPINTGVLIIASTSAVPGPLLDIDTTFRGSGAVYYTGASKADGSYSFDVQNGTYTVSAWYTSFTGNTPTATRKDQANVIILPRQTTSLDLAW